MVSQVPANERKRRFMDYNDKFGNCYLRYTISVMEGKWKWIILWKIHTCPGIRFNKLHSELAPIAHRTLSDQLKQLEESSLIHREQFQEIPPHVEYSLADICHDLMPALVVINEWGKRVL